MININDKENEMRSKLSCRLINQTKWILFSCFLLGFTLCGTAYGQSNLKGAIDFHVHSAPDSVDRVIDADDLARHAKEMGMRALVLKNHWEDTAALAYMVRKEVPGIELFGGITMDLSNGGINLEAVKHMFAMKGGWGRVVWLPTFDSEAWVKYYKLNQPFVPVSKDGKLLPDVLALLDLIAQHPDAVFETGHVSAEEVLLAVHAAHERGIKHIVVTHAMRPPELMTVEQMQEAAKDGAYLEFVYGAALGPKPLVPLSVYADGMRRVGAKYCIMATDFGGGKAPTAERPLHPEGLLNFMNAMVKEGIPQSDVDMMTKTNPAIALGLQP